MRFDKATLNVKLAQQRILQRQVEESRQAGETDRYADLHRQLTRVRSEVQSLLKRRGH